MLVPLLLLLLLAFVVRIFDLAGQSLWYDEGYTVMFAQRGWGDLIAGAAQYELNTPLHYIVLKAWMQFAGMSEFATRLLSVFAGVVTVALVIRLALLHRGSSSPTHRSLLPALLVALAPVCVLMSREVRMYALASCLCVASVLCFALALQRGSKTRWLGWALVSVAAFATHVLSAFVIGGALLVMGYQWWRQRRIQRAALLAALLVLVAILAFAALVLLHIGQSYGTTYTGRLDAIGTLMQSFASQLLPRLQPEGWVMPAALVAVALAVIAGVAAFKRVVTNPTPNPFPQGRGEVVWFIATLSIIAIAGFSVVTGKFSSRYPAIIAPLFLASIGMALTPVMIRNNAVKRIARVTFAGMTALFAFGLLQLHTNPLYANEDFRGAAAFIKNNRQADEPALLVSGHLAPVFSYYFGDAGWVALPNDPVLNVNNTLDYDSAVPAMNVALQGKAGAWLLLWQDDVIDPTGIVPALLRRQSEALGPALDTPEFHNLRLQRYRFFQPFAPLPAPLPAMTSTIEQAGRPVGLSGLGCRQPNATKAGEGLMEVQCFWQIKPFVPLSVYTKVSLRLTDASGKQVLQSDQAIAPRGLPYVPFEKPVMGLYFIELPRDLPAGDYTLRAIPYDDAGEIAPQIVSPIRITK
jgi:4-amino-4-deoxy-L-arabinose transferase-like glycosyltransferase